MTIGGYDTNDFVGNLTWFDTSATESWNLTGSVLAVADEMNLNPNGTDFEIEVQAGYPYIGLPTFSFKSLTELMSQTLNPDNVANFYCNDNGQYGGRSQCYWKSTYCSSVITNDYVLDLTINDNTFSIPIKNLLGDSMVNSRHDCDLYVGQLYNLFENSIRIGDPFLSAFLPVFDVENN